MIEVTKEKFFAVIGPKDVHPHTHTDHSSWEALHREVIGRTTLGYLCRDEHGKHTSRSRYFLVDQHANGQERQHGLQAV